AHGGHEHTRDNFVAVGYTDHAVEAMRLHHRLHAIGDQLAAGQRVFHADVSHSDTVIDANGVELKGNAARCPDGLLNEFTESLQMHMAGYHIDIGVADSNEGFVEIVFAHYTGRTQQAPVWCSFKAELDLI